MPTSLVFLLGTGTGVGKTWVASALIGHFRRRGRQVAVRKPVQSYPPGGCSDADLLAEASGEQPFTVCPVHRWYDLPMAPPMAAQALGRPPFTIAELADELVWPTGVEVGLVEGAGGVRSPLADDGDAVDLAVALHPQWVVLVAEAGLGTLNLIRMSIDALSELPVLVYLNRFDDRHVLHRRNREWLEARDGLVVSASPLELAQRLS